MITKNNITKTVVFSVLTLNLLVNSIWGSTNKSLLLTGPYMGQTPPGLTPQAFAYGIIESDLNGCPVFSPDGLEVFYSEMNGTDVMTSSQIGGLWTNPAVASFTAGTYGSWLVDEQTYD